MSWGWREADARVDEEDPTNVLFVGCMELNAHGGPWQPVTSILFLSLVLHSGAATPQRNQGSL
jgi:hypothetical protein